MATASSRSAGISRVEIVDRNFRDFVEHYRHGDVTLDQAGDLDRTDFMALLESQMLSRHLDIEARAMRARNEGYYTIGSAGHEGNAAVARATRHTDPAFLHYRSGAFMMERGRQVEAIDPVYDTALSLAASAEDPISGGRHKVWGSVELTVPPQTSTIASHLPKAVGTAVAHGLGRRSGTGLPVPADAIVVCSFGDAAINHATALAGLNTASWTAWQHLPCPILFVCEDNGIGISVQTPAGWVKAACANRPGIRYFHADGLDIAAGLRVAREAVDHVRHSRQPAFLHLSVVRLLGHAGSDVESRYRPLSAIERDEAHDPLLRSAAIGMEREFCSAETLLELYETARARVQAAAARAAGRPKLETREAIMAPLAPLDAEAVAREAVRADHEAARTRIFGGAERLPERGPARHMAVNIGRALHDLMAKYPESLLFGEDVARKGGVYTVTTGLSDALPPHRVFNTLLDETTILGLAQGAGLMGMLPIAEIQYLAYVHNAADQIRGEACSQQFFSNGQYANPMLVRIAGLGYQKGFGGHFHNDNSFTALRDIPGLVIACPARGDDAAAMLRTCAALCRVNGRVVAFLEPIALYMTRDLYEAGDGGWLFDYPAPDVAVGLGEPRIYNPGATDLLIVTYGNGVPMSLRVARELEREHAVATRIMDLRWLKPLNRAAIVAAARDTGRVLIVDEGRATGGIAEEIITVLVEEAESGPAMARVTGADSYIPLAEAANRVLPGETEIRDAALGLLT